VPLVAAAWALGRQTALFLTFIVLASCLRRSFWSMATSCAEVVGLGPAFRTLVSEIRQPHVEHVRNPCSLSSTPFVSA